VKTVVALLEFDGRKVAVDLEQPVVVEPVDVVQGRRFDLLGGAPGAAGVDQLCFELNLRPLDPKAVLGGSAPTVTCRAAFGPIWSRMPESGRVAVRLRCHRRAPLVSHARTVCRSVDLVFHLGDLRM
jgi:hypothetical protein